MQSTKSKVVLLEFPEEARAYLKAIAFRKKGVSLGSQLISLTPKTHAYLKKRGLNPQTSADYFDLLSHQKGLERSREMTKWIATQVNFKDCLDISFSYQQTLTWFLRLACHHFIWLLEVLHHVARKNVPETIQVASPTNIFVGGHFIWPEERYLGVLTEAFCKTYSIECVNFRPNDPLVFKKHLWKNRENIARLRLRNLLAPLLAPFYWWLVRYGIPQSKVFVASQRGQIKKLFGAKIYPVLLNEWKLASFFWVDRNSYQSLNLQIKNLGSAIDKEKELFSWQGVSFASLLQKRLEQGIAPLVLHLHSRTGCYHSILKRIKPSLVISAGDRSDDIFLGEVCQKLDVPSLMISHGSFTPPKNEYEKIEWGEQSQRLIRAPYTYTALQSPFAEDFLKVFPSPGKPVKTGSLVWGRGLPWERLPWLRRRILGDFQGKKVILYANTPKGRGANRFYVYETPDEYIRSLQELTEAVQQNPDLVLIIKFRPTYDMNRDDLKTLLGVKERVLINEKDSFLEILGVADLFISFSSTTIEEALQNRVPVLLYGGNGRYHHIPNAIEVGKDGVTSSSAVYCIREKQFLGTALPSILRMTEAVKGQTKFFEPYRYRQEKCVSLFDFVRESKKASYAAI